MADCITREDLYINVCILGPTSVGKSTLLNALFVKQYSDMKIKRTTTVPQRYCEYKIKNDKLVDKFLTEIITKNREKNNEIITKTQEGGIIKYEDIVELTYFVPPVIDLITLQDNVSLNIYDTPGLDDVKNGGLYQKYM